MKTYRRIVGKFFLSFGVLSMLFVPMQTRSQLDAITDKFLDKVTEEVAPQAVIDKAGLAKQISLLETMRNVYKNAKEAKEKADEFMAGIEFLKEMKETGVEVKRLYKLMESIVCGTEQFNKNIRLVGEFSACNKRMKIDMTVSRLEIIPKKMDRLIGMGVRLMKSDILRELRGLNDDMEKTMEELIVINDGLEQEVLAEVESMIMQLPWSVQYPISASEFN